MLVNHYTKPHNWGLDSYFILKLCIRPTYYPINLNLKMIWPNYFFVACGGFIHGRNLCWNSNSIYASISAILMKSECLVWLISHCFRSPTKTLYLCVHKQYRCVLCAPAWINSFILDNRKLRQIQTIFWGKTLNFDHE